MTPTGATRLAASVFSVTVGAVQLVSVSDEIAIGRQAQAQVKRETPEVSDALLTRVVPKTRSGRRDSAEFQSVRARLNTLPPARSMSR